MTKNRLALVDSRTADWPEIIIYPELVYQKSSKYLQPVCFN